LPAIKIFSRPNIASPSALSFVPETELYHGFGLCQYGKYA